VTIREAEDELFAGWRTRVPDLNPDGVVNEAKYRTASIKIMLVMKEVNDPEKTSGIGTKTVDLRDWLPTSERKKTWANVLRWIAGLYHLRVHGEILPWDRFTQDFTPRSLLNSVCVVNLKKSVGGGTNDPKSLAAAARRDASAQAQTDK